MNNATHKQNFVFISYNHRDLQWAKWLQKSLEWYRLPDNVPNEASGSHFIRPVFRDRDSLTSGVLNDELRRHLEASRYLVVICSPNAAQSAWVSQEVQAFIDMGRLDRIVPFIIDGKPQDYRHADPSQPLAGECFPLAIRQWNTDHPDRSLLGIAVRDEGKSNRHKAFIRLVAHLLGVRFDTLWQRFKRRSRRLLALAVMLSLVVLSLIYWFVIPVHLTIRINDQPSQLPAMGRGTLTVDGIDYAVTNPDTSIVIGALPGDARLSQVEVRFHAERFYADVRESHRLGWGIRQHFDVQLHRDSTFAVFAGTVYDGAYADFDRHPLSDAQVQVGRHTTTTDANGHFRIDLPFDEQAVTQPISISKPNYQPFHREDESPSRELTYILER